MNYINFIYTTIPLLSMYFYIYAVFIIKGNVVRCCAKADIFVEEMKRKGKEEKKQLNYTHQNIGYHKNSFSPWYVSLCALSAEVGPLLKAVECLLIYSQVAFNLIKSKPYFWSNIDSYICALSFPRDWSLKDSLQMFRLLAKTCLCKESATNANGITESFMCHYYWCFWWRLKECHITYTKREHWEGSEI